MIKLNYLIIHSKLSTLQFIATFRAAITYATKEKMHLFGVRQVQRLKTAILSETIEARHVTHPRLTYSSKFN